VNTTPEQTALELKGTNGAREPTPDVASPAIRDRLFRLAYRLLWNHDDAEDAVQNVLAAALTKGGQLRDGDKWWPWICRIVVRQCHRLGRGKSLRRRHEAKHATMLRPASEEAGDADDLKVLVRELLGKLPRRQREVLVLRHFEEMPYDEIAVVLSMSPSTARVHAQAARERMLELISQRNPNGGSRPGPG